MANVIGNVLVGVAVLKIGVAGVAAATVVGYTEDGVTIEYSPDIADIETEEETFPINRVITKETLTITCNCAESSIANIGYALAGADGHASPILIGAAVGGGVLQTCSLKIDGIPPVGGGTSRTIDVLYAHPIGTMGMSYKKGEKTIVPMSFLAYKGDTAEDVCSITDV